MLHKRNGQKCKNVINRDNWVEYLNQRSIKTKTRLPTEVVQHTKQKFLENLSNKKPTTEILDKTIVDSWRTYKSNEQNSKGIIRATII